MTPSHASLTTLDSGANRDAPPPTRRHDLDALRAAAMLLGIAYHSALSFSLGAGWLVCDPKQSRLLYLFQSFVHGFRMQLFMLLSGFFTAMLWRKGGLKKLWLNRFRRILLPCVAGLFTVVPAINWAGAHATRSRYQTAAEKISAGSPDAEQGSGTRDLPLPNAQPSVERPPWPAQKATVLSGANPSFVEFGTHWINKAVAWTVGWIGRPAGSMFILLWFLWFLVWLLPFFSLYAAAAQRLVWRIPPHVLLVSQRNILWLLPLTLVPALRMNTGGSDFGPETSMGILPEPRVLLYYGIFFGFGALYFESGDPLGRLGRSWRRTLPLTLLVVFPTALELASGVFGIREKIATRACPQWVCVSLQTLYAWLMCFSLMGLFRSLLKREYQVVRNLCDASYWCYLSHLPAVILLQGAVVPWNLPALVKFMLVLCGVCFLLVSTYATLVRHGWIGTFLNGRPSGRRQIGQ